MTADEIRKRNPQHWMVTLQEIAAQLAELNAQLKALSTNRGIHGNKYMALRTTDGL